MKKDEDKKEQKQSQPNKRGFLKPVRLAISALLASPFVTHIGVSNADVIDALNKTTETSEIRTASNVEPLIITRATQLNQQQPNLQHESHYSHYSHESHSSHVSHQSHFSSSF